ncbi:MAG TPA: peptide chain release factor N(5)-glutamine methyltransferase [Vicinamibacterales bacterium]|nr:peptide chain release factor N(5)-glutamine methyltransferase [Vicinamibacterales bacterium]
MPGSVYERIVEARKALVRAGLPSADAAIDAEVLARHALGWDRARLIAEGRDPAPAGFDDEFAPMIDRRARREPVAFITGRREFWGLDFEVSRDVLIPRPETELIVEGVCERRPDRGNVRVIVDVGTGSGCLAVALAREFPAAGVIAVDISAAAIRVARRNAARHAVADRIRFVHGDLLEAVDLRADVIVSNPPYVPANVQLARDVAHYEPAVALYSGDEGLTAVARLVASARARLKDDGLFVFEFGLGQDDRVRELAVEAGWTVAAIKEDLQSIPRVAVLSAVSARRSPVS